MSVLTFNNGTFHQYTPQGQDVQGSVNLNKLSDVTVLNPQNNQVLKYNSTSLQWENVAAGAIVDLAIDDLTDVTITSPLDTEILSYDAGTNTWRNVTNTATVTEVDGGTF